MIIDLHCDTILRLFEKGNINMQQNDLHVDIQKLQKGGIGAEFFAFFINSKAIPKYQSSYEYFARIYDFSQKIFKNNEDDIEVALNYENYKKIIEEGKIAAFLTIEGGDAIGNSLENLHDAYKKGIRLMTLTWNYPNAIGYPNLTESYMRSGLTDFGKSVVEEMNNLGMIIDVSHLSDEGFYDVADISSQPFVASHSNAREIRNNRRNLTDRMIKVLANKGGVIGINFFAPFLSEGNVSRIDDIVRHIVYIRNVGGVEVLALGSDFDGINCELEIKDISKMNLITRALKEKGFSEREIEMIMYKNAERILKIL